MFFNDLNINKKDKYYLIILLIFSIILTTDYINFNMNLGIYCSDVFIYLLNSLYFTGVNIKSTGTIYLSPIICFLTSILFRIGLIDKLAIFIITGTFAIFGNIGMYLILKTRFNELYSLSGSIIYSCLSINLTWLANGTLDIPAVSITIWIVLFMILAVKSNPKYYYIVFPLFIIGFFTRYTVVLITPTLILYYLVEHTQNNYKFIFKGTILGLIIAAIILIPIYIMSMGQIGVAGQISGGISGNLGSVTDLAYNTNTFYYIENFLNFISSSEVIFINRTPDLTQPTILSYSVILILTIGSLIYLKNKKLDVKNNILPTTIFLIAILTYTHISSFITIILLFIGLLLISRNSEDKKGIVMFSWIMVYLIFFSYYTIKVNRYIIPTMPPLIYMLLSSIELIQERISINKQIIPLLVILFIIQGFLFTITFNNDDFTAPEEISEHIIGNIPNYENLKIGVYNTRFYDWYLHTPTYAIPNTNSNIVDNSNVDYYISDIKFDNLNNYSEIKEINKIYLYKKRS